MATPFKRLCVRATLSKPPSTTQCRAISHTHPSKASPTASTDLDDLAPQPGITHPSAFPPDTASDLTRLKNTELSSRAHRELEQHRELRELVRLAAWEMPLLASLAQPFTPPTAQQILRWRYTAYMGESHPAARKVVVDFDPTTIPNLSAGQLQTLLKLAGPRYDPDKQRVKMSCESFETQAQNKRYLADTIAKLVAAAREGDSFADVPLDTRHVKAKKVYKFPEAWVLTAERRKALEARRRQVLLEEGRKVGDGRMVSGVQAIEEARKVSVKAVEEPVMAEARRGMVRGKVGKREMGQGGGRAR